MCLLTVLFDKRTTANLFPTTSLHVILANFTAAGLIKLSPVVEGAFALAFFQATEKEAYALLYYGSKFLLQK